MKAKLYFALGAFAVAAVACALASRGVSAQQVADPPAVDQQDPNQIDAQIDRDQNLRGETGRLETTDTTEHTSRDVTTSYQHRANSNAFKASELLGMNVRGRDNDDVGEIEDLLIGKDGRVIYAVVAFGGFLGLGDKNFAVPLDAIDFVKHDDDTYARMDVTEDTLKNMEGFDDDNWPQQANRNFTRGAETRQAERPATDADVPR
jgi:hypothetical protein